MLLLSWNSTIGSQNQRMGVIAQIAPLAESVPPIMVRRNGARGRVADRRAMAVGYSASPAGRSRRVSADRPRLRRVLGPSQECPRHAANYVCAASLSDGSIELSRHPGQRVEGLRSRLCHSPDLVSVSLISGSLA